MNGVKVDFQKAEELLKSLSTTQMDIYNTCDEISIALREFDGIAGVGLEALQKFAYSVGYCGAQINTLVDKIFTAVESDKEFNKEMSVQWSTQEDDEIESKAEKMMSGASTVASSTAKNVINAANKTTSNVTSNTTSTSGKVNIDEIKSDTSTARAADSASSGN